MYVTVCSEGLERRGGDDVRTCTGNESSLIGMWSGNAPDCTGITFLMCYVVALEKRDHFTVKFLDDTLTKDFF